MTRWTAWITGLALAACSAPAPGPAPTPTPAPAPTPTAAPAPAPAAAPTPAPAPTASNAKALPRRRGLSVALDADPPHDPCAERGHSGVMADIVLVDDSGAVRFRHVVSLGGQAEADEKARVRDLMGPGTCDPTEPDDGSCDPKPPEPGECFLDPFDEALVKVRLDRLKPGVYSVVVRRVHPAHLRVRVYPKRFRLTDDR